MTKATYKVGDKVRVTKNVNEHKKGDIRIISEIGSSSGYFDYRFEGGGYVHEQNIELVSKKPTKNQRITALEKEVETLKAEVEALKAAQKVTVGAPEILVKSEADIAKIAEGFAKMFDKEKKPTPNEQRKAIIDEAKAFVEELTAYINPKSQSYRPVHPKYGKIKTPAAFHVLIPYFTVKADNREVICVLKCSVRDIGVIDKAIAKCAPGDVFNADIGKAIALGRALGLDVSKFEKAVQPSEVVVGMKVRGTTLGQTYNVPAFHKDERLGGKFGKAIAVNGVHNSTWVGTKQVTIIDDTEAQY